MTNLDRDAVVVNGFEFADAMSIAPFAARDGMPIYLTHSGKLSDPEELNQYNMVYKIGGEMAVSPEVEKQLGSNVERIEGEDRYLTNLNVLNQLTYDSDQVIIATGKDFVDALTGSGLDARENSGVALTKNGLSNHIRRYSINNSISRFKLIG